MLILKKKSFKIKLTSINLLLFMADEGKSEKQSEVRMVRKFENKDYFLFFSGPIPLPYLHSIHSELSNLQGNDSRSHRQGYCDFTADSLWIILEFYKRKSFNKTRRAKNPSAA